MLIFNIKMISYSDFSKASKQSSTFIRENIYWVEDRAKKNAEINKNLTSF